MLWKDFNEGFLPFPLPFGLPQHRGREGFLWPFNSLVGLVLNGRSFSFSFLLIYGMENKQ